MSKLLEKKDIIHIATEIVVLIGITFYFSSKNKKLLDHIEDLSKRLEEQEDLLQKHEKIIMQLVQNINNQQHTTRHTSSPTEQNSLPKPVIHQPTYHKRSKQSTIKEQNHMKTIPAVKVAFKNIEETQESKRSKIVLEEHDSNDEESCEDSDLDKEIAAELQELDDNEDGLKKRF